MTAGRFFLGLEQALDEVNEFNEFKGFDSKLIGYIECDRCGAIVKVWHPPVKNDRRSFPCSWSDVGFINFARPQAGWLADAPCTGFDE